MPTTISLNGTFVLDETQALQDNDIAFASLPQAFRDRLTAIGATRPALDAAQSATNLITISATGPVSGLALRDATGGALDGDFSGLFTIGGTNRIFLYADATNPLIVYGSEGTGSAANPTGDVVFALYLQPNATSTSIQAYSVLFEPIQHPDGTNPDDRVDLGDAITLAASSAVQFSFAGAPSGQNVFMAFGTPASAIIVTGDSAADTVNTGQGGGPTTLGTNSQGIKPGNGLYFTFVSGMNASLLGANLSPAEAGSASNILYGGLLTTTGGSVDIVQKSGSPNDGVDIKLSAYTTAVETGATYFAGLTNDTPVAITGVIVTNASGTNVTSQVTISYNPDGSATLRGVLSGWTLNYTTTSGHTRLRVDNAEPSGTMSFDIGGFGTIETSATRVPIGDGFSFDDDGPDAVITLTGNSVTTDDSNVTDTDAAALFSSTTTVLGRDGGTSSTVLVINTLDSGLDTTDGTDILLYDEGGTIRGRAGGPAGEVIFEITLSGGNVTLTQFDSVRHDDPANANERATLADNVLLARVTATDGDGDTDTASVDISGAIGFLDDGPAVTLDLVTGAVLTVDETDVNPTASITGASFFTNISAGAGEDEEGASEAFSLAINTAIATGVTTTSGAVVTLQRVSATEVRGIYGAGLTAFVVTIDADDGDLTLTQSVALRHANAANPDDAFSLTAGALLAVLTVTDGDGDTGSDREDIGVRLVFEDDGPALTDAEDLQVANLVNAIDTGAFTFDPGTDGSGGFRITSAPTTNGLTWAYADVNGDGAIGQNEIIGKLNGTNLYSLIVNPDGAYTFKLLSALTGTSLKLDTRDIKAGGPDSHWIDVGVLNSDQFVQIIGFKNGADEAINESNANVGVDNGNLDPGEAIRFHLVSSDPNSAVLGDETLVDITSLSIGTKSAGSTTYNYTAYNNGVAVFNGTTTVGKNGTILVSNGGVFFDEVSITLASGNAAKLGLGSIEIKIAPPDLLLDFAASLRDGDGDATGAVGFSVGIDGDGNGGVTPAAFAGAESLGEKGSLVPVSELSYFDPDGSDAVPLAPSLSDRLGLSIVPEFELIDTFDFGNALRDFGF